MVVLGIALGCVRLAPPVPAPSPPAPLPPSGRGEPSSAPTCFLTVGAFNRLAWVFARRLGGLSALPPLGSRPRIGVRGKLRGNDGGGDLWLVGLVFWLSGFSHGVAVVGTCVPCDVHGRVADPPLPSRPLRFERDGFSRHRRGFGAAVRQLLISP